MIQFRACTYFSLSAGHINFRRLVFGRMSLRPVVVDRRVLLQETTTANVLNPARLTHASNTGGGGSGWLARHSTIENMGRSHRLRMRAMGKEQRALSGGGGGGRRRRRRGGKGGGAVG